MLHKKTMMTSQLELSFDCKPHIYNSMVLNSFGEHTTAETRKLEEFVARLEEERIKIDAFKRELPLCMQLLTYVTEASRQELQSHRPLLEEFIPLKNTISSSQVIENEENISSDKANWITSVQLWNQETGTNKLPAPAKTDTNLTLNSNQGMYERGAFSPFMSEDKNSSSSGAAISFPELALASSHKEDVQDNKNSLQTISRRDNSVSETEQVCGTANSTQTHRKARRCWSADLHRRFVNALQMLGGPHVATPKQIRELMKVDGLTNDEVKSHLQKYRLHTRSPQAVTAAPRLVVLGGIWVPQEYAVAAARGGAPAPSLYGARATAATPQVSPPFCSAEPPVLPPQPSKNQLHYNPQQFHVYNKLPLTQRSSFLESDIQGCAGNPSESIGGDKSECGSWKGDSGGENGAKRPEAEESINVNFISFNF